jgi:hypothetical protein
MTPEEDEQLRDRWRLAGKLAIEALMWVGVAAGGVFWPPCHPGDADAELEPLRDLRH